jgi:hypothetical protein
MKFDLIIDLNVKLIKKQQKIKLYIYLLIVK